MNLLLEQEDRIRRYLLGQSTLDETQQVEIDLLRDAKNVEHLLLVEDELVADYARGTLAADEAAAMTKSFFITPERQKRLMIAQAMVNEASAADEQTMTEEWGEEIKVAGETKAENRRREVGGQQRGWFRMMLTHAIAGQREWKIAACATVLIAICAGVWFWTWRESDVERGLAALNQVYRVQRPLEARLSGFGYADYRATLGNEKNEFDYRILDEAEMWLRKAVREKADAKSLHGAGQFYLAKKEFGKAIDHFTEALKAAPSDAKLHSDFGAALFERGKAIAPAANAAGNIEDFARALDQFNQAISLDSNLLEARFNRALVYEALMLPQARDEWLGYLERDRTSPWAAEAQQHLKRIDEDRKKISQDRKELTSSLLSACDAGDDERAWQIITWNRNRLGSLPVQAVVDLYLDAAAHGQTGEADRYLQAIAYSGEVEIAKSGERWTNDLAAFYKTTTMAQRKTIFLARHSVLSGLGRLDGGEIEVAVEDFEKARNLFQQVGDNGEFLLAHYMKALADAANYKTGQARSAFEELSQRCDQAQYKWLLTRSLIRLVGYQFDSADYSAVIEQSSRALKVAEEVNDADSRATLTIQSAEAYYYLGDHHAALRLYFGNVVMAGQRPLDMSAKWSVYRSMALPLNSLGLHSAAAEYQKEALRLALESGRPRLIGRSQISLAETYGLQHRYGEAVEQARLVFEQAQKIASQPHQTELLAYAAIKMGQLQRQSGDTASAISSYNRAIELYEQLKSPAFDYVARKGRLLAMIAQGSFQAVEKEVEQVLNIFEQYRAKIREESYRNSFFDAEQSVYDIVINFRHSQENDQAAFDLSERSRARTLLDLVSSSPEIVLESSSYGGAEPPRHQVSPLVSLSEIRRRMPEGTQILQYSVLEDKLLVWLVSKENFVCKERKISGGEMNNLTLSYLRLVAQGAAANQQQLSDTASRLYALLIEPVEALLDKRKQLCLTPDKILNHLPYAALASPKTGRFLIEDYSIVFAPSATMFIISSEAAAPKERVERERLLIVADPTFDRAAFPGLPYLPAARRQAKAFTAAAYQPSTSLVGEGATKTRLLGELEHCDVLHFALHCLVDERSPMHSKLLLAKPETEEREVKESDGALEAGEIYRLRLSKLRLVVLAACRSGVERYYAGEGMIGISRAFIARRIPLVVASLWEVESDATADLMIKFHENRRLKSLPTTEALRQAQLEMLRDSDGAHRAPYFWAAFICIGGQTSF